MLKLTKLALALFASTSLVACGGSGSGSDSGSSSSAGVTPSEAQEVSLQVFVQPKASAGSQLAVQSYGVSIASVDDNAAYACLDIDRNSKCSNGEYRVPVVNGKATLKFPKSELANGDVNIVAYKRGDYALGYSAQKVVDENRDSVYLNTLSTLQNKDANFVAQAGLPDQDYSTVDITAQSLDQATAVTNDTLYMSGFATLSESADDNSVTGVTTTVAESQNINITTTNLYLAIQGNINENADTSNLLGKLIQVFLSNDPASAFQQFIDNLVNGSGGNTDTPAQNTAPVADFECTASNLIVTCTDKSTDADGDKLTYSWSIGGAQERNSKNAAWQVPKAGDYEVTLKVSDGQVAKMKKATVNVPVSEDPVRPPVNTNNTPSADFSYTADGLVVTFTNKSSDKDAEDLLQMTWDFGDGQTSNSSSATVTHTYQKKGTYTVILTVDDGIDSDLKKTSIAVDGDVPVGNNKPVASFSYDVKGLTVTITNASSDKDGDLLSYDWDMGDGTVRHDSGKSFTHTYAKEGSYTVTVTVSDGQDSANTNKSFKVSGEPVVDPEEPVLKCTLE